MRSERKAKKVLQAEERSDEVPQSGFVQAEERSDEVPATEGSSYDS